MSEAAVAAVQIQDDGRVLYRWQDPVTRHELLRPLPKEWFNADGLLRPVYRDMIYRVAVERSRSLPTMYEKRVACVSDELSECVCVFRAPHHDKGVDAWRRNGEFKWLSCGNNSKAARRGYCYEYNNLVKRGTKQSLMRKVMVWAEPYVPPASERLNTRVYLVSYGPKRAAGELDDTAPMMEETAGDA